MNGDFETAPYDTLGTVTGWTVGGDGGVAEAEGATTSGNHSAAFNASASQGTTLAQTLQTSVGHLYVLEFDAGTYGQAPGMQVRVQAIGSGTALDETITPPSENAPDLSAVVFQHYQFFFTADSTSTILRFTSVGQDNSNAGLALDTVAVGAQQGPPPTFAQWQMWHFTAAQRGNPSISDWNADPDGDGISNGLEYLFDTDPLGGVQTWEAAALPHLAIDSSSGSPYLTYIYRRLIGWSGNPAVVSVSDDLVTWDNSQNQIQAVGNPVATGDGITEMVTVRLKTAINTTPNQHKFLRLSLTQ